MSTAVVLEPLLEKIISWAALRGDILAVALVGSHARVAATAGSDVDLVLVSTDVATLLQQTDWLGEFGEVATVAREDWGRVTSLRAHYAGGLEVEFGLTDASWAELPLDPGTYAVVAHGMRPLYDPGLLLQKVQRWLGSEF